MYLNKSLKPDLMEVKILRVIQNYLQQILKKSLSDEAAEDNFTALVMNTIDKIMTDTDFEIGFDDLNRESKTSLYLSRGLFILFI